MTPELTEKTLVVAPVRTGETSAKPLAVTVTFDGRDLNQTVWLTLQCLTHMSADKYYGVSTLVDVLRGSQSKKLLTAKLDRIPEYGVLVGMKREDVTSMIEWLIENHYILQTKGSYPVLHPTYDGVHYSETVTARKLERLKEYLEGKRTVGVSQ